MTFSEYMKFRFQECELSILIMVICFCAFMAVFGVIKLVKVLTRTATPSATNSASHGVSVKSSHTDWTRAAWAEVNEGAD